MVFRCRWVHHESETVRMGEGRRGWPLELRQVDLIARVQLSLKAVLAPVVQVLDKLLGGGPW
jgi:hypothetical protein